MMHFHSSCPIHIVPIRQMEHVKKFVLLEYTAIHSQQALAQPHSQKPCPIVTHSMGYKGFAQIASGSKDPYFFYNFQRIYP